MNPDDCPVTFHVTSTKTSRAPPSPPLPLVGPASTAEPSMSAIADAPTRTGCGGGCSWIGGRGSSLCHCDAAASATLLTRADLMERLVVYFLKVPTRTRFSVCSRTVPPAPPILAGEDCRTPLPSPRCPCTHAGQGRYVRCASP